MELKEYSVDSKQFSENGKPAEFQLFQLFRKRWAILFLYWVYTIAGAMHWIEYSVIADVIVKYYSVSFSAVDWSAMVFLVMYIPFSIPGSYILDKLGLRDSVLIGAIGISIGAWLKVLSVDPNRFWIYVLSQCFIAIFQVLILPIPSKLAAVWFGPREVFLATNIGVIAIQVAVGVGFVIPVLMVEQGSLQEIHKSLQNLSYVFAVPITITIPLLYFFFDDGPPTPPSIAQFKVEQNEKAEISYKESLRNLLTNRSFLLLILVYGVNVGMSLMISILLNQMVLHYHPDSLKDVGIMGLLMTFSSIASSILIGLIGTKFKKLKEIVWTSCISSLILMIFFFFFLNQNIAIVYIFIVMLSFSANCHFCSGLDLGVELTYPEPVGASIGLLTASYQIFGILFTYLYSFLYYNFSIFTANLCAIFTVLIANSLLIFIKFDFKRNAANECEK